MDARQSSAFHDLVRIWNQREDARTAGDIRSLNEASIRLDQQRVLTRAMLGIR